MRASELLLAVAIGSIVTAADPAGNWPQWRGGRLYIRNQGLLTSYDIKAR